MNFSLNDISGKKTVIPVFILGIFLLASAFSLPAAAAEEPEGELAIVEIIRTGQHETVLILNRTMEKLDLCGYVLREKKNDKIFDFGKEADCKTTIPPLSIIRVHSGTGSSSYYASWQDLPWTQSEVWNDSEDEATLLNPHGEVISTFDYDSEEMDDENDDHEDEE
jgi:hypothetical protein